MAGNPWIQAPEANSDGVEDAVDAPVTPRVDVIPPAAPQSGVSLPRETDRLPRRVLTTQLEQQTRLWWIGVHGGAGESTLEQLLEGSRAACHAWPIDARPGAIAPRVMLVARTNARGLRAAQLAATEWASGDVPVHLEGLVLLADAPGRLPKPLRQFVRLVAGGVPRVWELPWVEAWRVGEPVSEDTAPRSLTHLLEQLRSMSPVSRSTHHPLS